MLSRTKFQIPGLSAVIKLRISKNYLIVGTVPGEFTMLDLRCQHADVEICEHRRTLQVGRCWYSDCWGDTFATGYENRHIRLWDLKGGSSLLSLVTRINHPLSCSSTQQPSSVAHATANSVYGICRPAHASTPSVDTTQALGPSKPIAATCLHPAARTAPCGSGTSTTPSAHTYWSA
ncbi:hypothetical protein BU16DRAFT_388657 [Lophium mytilinum]|uniref:WD40 repeat-like protein n=1 Tax=Lophium mytilinum TaxID=390894 RepID=A0A6A6QSK8_9PEZI|nr:hypothetical protein BU16DRAFT_388657 [Lophium mytilinum]